MKNFGYVVFTFAILLSAETAIADSNWQEEMRNKNLTSEEVEKIIRYDSCLSEGVVFHSTRIGYVLSADDLIPNGIPYYAYQINQLRMIQIATTILANRMSLDLYENRREQAEKSYRRLQELGQVDEIQTNEGLTLWPLVDCGMSEAPDHWIFIERYRR